MIGIDIVEVERIKGLITDSFLARLFTNKEIGYINSKHIAPTTVAGLFAAKEAIMKALGSGIGNGVSFQMIEITHTLTGQPVVSLYGEALSLLRTLGNSIQLSISHTNSTAVAVAVVMRQCNIPYKL